MGLETTRPPTVGIAGTFDVANFGDLLFPRIFEHELRRRIPACRVVPFSPFGRLHPVEIDGGRHAEPLGAWTRSRAREIGESLDAFVVGGGELAHTADGVYAAYYGRDPEELIRMRPSGFFIEGLGPAIEPHCPTVWHGLGVPFNFDAASARVRAALADRRYVTVRDQLSRERVLATGVECDVAVVPDSALLLDRLFDESALERRLRHLRQLGQYPEHERPIVVQGSAMLTRNVDGVAKALAEALGAHPDRPVVFVEIGPCHGDGEFIDAVLPRCSNPAHRLPSVAPAEDIVTAVANAAAYVGLSLHGAITASVYGVPMAILNLVGYEKLDGFARLLEQPELIAREVGEIGDRVDRALGPGNGYSRCTEFRRRVDEHFDRIAEIVLEAHGGGEPPSDTDTARQQHVAYKARSEELLRERAVFEELLADAETELAEMRVQLAHERETAAVLQGRIDHAEREVHRVNSELLARLDGEQARVRELEARLDGGNASMRAAQRLMAAREGVRKRAAAIRRRVR